MVECSGLEAQLGAFFSPSSPCQDTGSYSGVAEADTGRFNMPNMDDGTGASRPLHSNSSLYSDLLFFFFSPLN